MANLGLHGVNVVSKRSGSRRLVVAFRLTPVEGVGAPAGIGSATRYSLKALKALKAAWLREGG